MAGKWETREKRTRRMAIILSVILHIAVIAALSVNSGSGEGEESWIQSIFNGNKGQADQTADLDQS